jgi:hypothetical protein
MFQPHLASLRERPNIPRVLKGTDGGWVFACGEDTESVLGMNFQKAKVSEEGTEGRYYSGKRFG